MADFSSRAQSIARAMQRIAVAQGRVEEASLLGASVASFVQTGYDNLDGGTDIWSLVLRVPLETFAGIGKRQGELESTLLESVKPLIRTEAGNWVSEVVIAPNMGESEEDELELPQQPPQPSFWRSGLLRAFISHPSSIKDKAHYLKDALVAEAVVGFVAHDDIEPTREWLVEIESALRTMDVLIALVTPEFVGSRWCDQEVGVAIGRGKLVIPLRIGVDPHGFMGKFQGLQAKGKKPAEVAKSVAEILIKSEITGQRMVEALISELEGSTSWARSKQIVTQLEKAKRIAPQQIERLRAALDSNGEVKMARGVPERIFDLASKHQ